MTLTPSADCCCDCGPCPTKGDTGLPDELVTNFSVLTSDDEGMPSNEEINTCDGGAAYMRFTHSAEILELLTSITWDYVSSATTTGCGCCCFLYNGRLTDDSECPGGTNDCIILGSSPLPVRVLNGIAVYTYWTGTDTADPEIVFSEPDPPYCCTDITEGPGEGEWTLSNDYVCDSVCGKTAAWEDADSYVSENILITSAQLYICVSGNVVTICMTLTVENECKLYEGDGQYRAAHLGTHPTCNEPHTISNTGTEGCTTNTTAVLTLNVTVDLSMVAGADIWEKMQAAEFVSDYEFSICNCGAMGCTDIISTRTCACSIVNYNICGPACDAVDVGDPGSPCSTDDTEDAPVDIDCHYAVGTMDIAFST